MILLKSPTAMFKNREKPVNVIESSTNSLNPRILHVYKYGYQIKMNLKIKIKCSNPIYFIGIFIIFCGKFS